MRNRAPIRLRLTLWYVALLAVILAVFASGVYLILRQVLFHSLNESTLSRANDLLSVVQYDGNGLTLPVETTRGGPTRGEHFVRLFDSAGRLTFDNSSHLGTVPVDVQVVDQALRGESSTHRFKIGEDGDLMVATAFPVVRSGEIVGALEVGQSADDVSEALALLLLIMGLAYPVVLVIVSFGGVLLARKALSPIDDITRTARSISAEDLHQRLNLSLPEDEVGRLARTFDEMIGRLDNAFQRQRQFTADASHELRTPLTIMKGQVDVSLQRDREPAEYRHVLKSINGEVDLALHYGERCPQFMGGLCS